MPDRRPKPDEVGWKEDVEQRREKLRREYERGARDAEEERRTEKDRLVQELPALKSAIESPGVHSSSQRRIDSYVGHLFRKFDIRDEVTRALMLLSARYGYDIRDREAYRIEQEKLDREINELMEQIIADAQGHIESRSATQAK